MKKSPYFLGIRGNKLEFYFEINRTTFVVVVNYFAFEDRL